MIWIRERKGLPILEDLKYLGWQTDRDNYNSTPLMSWIHYR